MGTVVGASFAFPFADFEARATETASDVFARGGQTDPAARRFLKQLHEDAVKEDLEDLSVDDVVFLAADFWTWARDRAAGETKLRAQPGHHADGRAMRREIFEIATADKPFLVDSIMGEINAQGIEVLAMFHPIVSIDHGAAGAIEAVSMMQVHVEPLDDETRERVLKGLRATLADVEVSVADYQDMRARMDIAIDELRAAATSAPPDELEESIAFLQWLRDDHFAFLGCRVYDFPTDKKGLLLREEPDIVDGTGRGVLRDEDRHVLRRGSEPAIITEAIQEFLREPSPLIVAKSNLRSRVHRRVYMDYIGVKRYRDDGAVIGETRFVGLFTAAAYLAHATQVPLIRRKVRRVLERAGKKPGSHNYKQLTNILETYPRDELFQSDEEELREIALGVLHLFDRPRRRHDLLFILHAARPGDDRHLLAAKDTVIAELD